MGLFTNYVVQNFILDPTHKHRPISLLATIRKLYETVISIRVLNSVSLQKSQFGFLKRRSIVDCIFLPYEGKKRAAIKRYMLLFSILKARLMKFKEGLCGESYQSDLEYAENYFVSSWTFLIVLKVKLS